jgi:hypothetical protein
MRPTTFRALLLLATLAPPVLVAAFASRASACPFCDAGPSGVNEVREGVFDSNFWPRFAATLAPFPILAGIVALIYFGPPGLARRRPHSEDATTAPASSSQADRIPRDQ